MPRETRLSEVIVGRFGGPWGLRGWVHLRSFTDPPENLLDYAPWLVEGPEGWQPLAILATQPHRDAFVVQIAGCSNRDAARERFHGVHVAVAAASLPTPADDEYYWRDLMGLQVSNVDGAVLGTVQRLLPTGANDVLVVRASSPSAPGRKPRELLIPFVDPFVRSVDLAAGQLVVDWDPEF